MEYLPVGGQNRQQVNRFLEEHWFSTDMIVRGTRIDMTKAQGILARDGGGIAGLLTYAVRGGVCEILSLDSLRPGAGIGTSLVGRAVEIARRGRCEKVIVVTTNDNINAIRFYQKRGFDMARLYRNALDVSRKMKPEIPLIGENGIPLKHEIEFEMKLGETE